MTSPIPTMRFSHVCLLLIMYIDILLLWYLLSIKYNCKNNSRGMRDWKQKKDC